MMQQLFQPTQQSTQHRRCVLMFINANISHNSRADCAESKHKLRHGALREEERGGKRENQLPITIHFFHRIMQDIAPCRYNCRHALDISYRQYQYQLLRVGITTTPSQHTDDTSNKKMKKDSIFDTRMQCTSATHELGAGQLGPTSMNMHVHTIGSSASNYSYHCLETTVRRSVELIFSRGEH